MLDKTKLIGKFYPIVEVTTGEVVFYKPITAVYEMENVARLLSRCRIVTTYLPIHLPLI